MEKKYYFRGLGLGIIVTALIMGIVLSRGEKREMTDAEIIARAKELGMTENTRLVEPSETAEDQEETEPPETAEDQGETELPETAEDREKTELPAKNEAAAEPVKKDVAVAQPKDEVGEPVSSNRTTQNKQPTADTNEMTKQDEDTGNKETPPTEESPKNTDTKPSVVKVTIVSGDGSYTVAKKLEEAGVVFSASDYDNYLCQNGYDKRLRTGTFQIPAGASNEQIAKIVTSQP